MPRLRFNRKDRAGQSIGIEAAMTGDFSSRFNQWCLKALAVWRYRGHRPHRNTRPSPAPEGAPLFFDAFSRRENACPAGSRNRGHIAS
jgi:hypothetical protein